MEAKSQYFDMFQLFLHYKSILEYAQIHIGPESNCYRLVRIAILTILNLAFNCYSKEFFAILTTFLKVAPASNNPIAIHSILISTFSNCYGYIFGDYFYLVMLSK